MLTSQGEAQPGETRPERAAWQVVDRLPSDLVESNARFAQRAIDPGGDRPLLWCDSPVLDAGPLGDSIALITGWAVGHAPLVEITVALNQQPAQRAVPRVFRPDVAGIHPWAQDAAQSGFRFLLDLRAQAPGPQRLVISARDECGRATSLWRWVVVDPQRSYRRWLDGRVPTAPGGLAEMLSTGERECPSFAVAVLPGADGDAPRATRYGLRNGTYKRWRFLDGSEAARSPVAFALDGFLAGADEYLVFVDGGDLVERHALLALAEAARLSGPPDLIYADDDVISAGRRSTPRFKPGWSPERLLCENYIGSLVAVSRSAARQAREVDREPVDSVYELMLRLIDTDPWVERVADVLISRHSPVISEQTALAEARSVEALARRRRIPARVEALPGSHVRRVSWELREHPRVSVVIPTAGTAGMLVRCVESIRARTTYANLELVIVDDSAGVLDPGELALDGIEHRIIPHHGEFNFSRLINLGAAEATGDQLVILNDDTEVQTPDWIERLLEWGQHPGVGLVGPKLLYAEGNVQQAGVPLTDLSGLVGQALAGLPDDGAGPDGALVSVRNWAAVGLTCALVSRADFDSIGGVDEELAVELGDVDFALRLLATGRRVVWTPHAVLLHHERASRGDERHALDHARFRVRWDRLLRAGDPFGNPNVNGGGDLRIHAPDAAARAAARAKVRAPDDGPPTRPSAPDLTGGRGGRGHGGSLRPSVERLEPDVAAGSLVLAEHEARYRWASSLVVGREVVDAGCGVGYGARICAQAGAASVLGFDASAEAIADAQAAAQAWPDRPAADRVRYEVRDLLDCDLPTASCDVAMCFEAIEHVADPERALDELHRVVRRGGLLLVSSPNPGVYPGGNPHHVRELAPERLRELLKARFRNVRLFPQHAWAASLVGDDHVYEAADGSAVLDARLSKLAAGEPGRSLYTVAVASDGRLPTLGAVLMLARADEADQLREHLAFAANRAELLAGELKRARGRAAIAERRANAACGALARQGEELGLNAAMAHGRPASGSRRVAAALEAARGGLTSRIGSR